MTKKYLTKDGETRYMLQAYFGVDPFTGKQKRTTRRGFKRKRTQRKQNVSYCYQSKKMDLQITPANRYLKRWLISGWKAMKQL